MHSSKRKAKRGTRLTGIPRGATLIEYALLVALASVVAIIALMAILGPKA